MNSWSAVLRLVKISSYHRTIVLQCFGMNLNDLGYSIGGQKNIIEKTYSLNHNYVAPSQQFAGIEKWDWKIDAFRCCCWSFSFVLGLHSGLDGYSHKNGQTFYKVNMQNFVRLLFFNLTIWKSTYYCFEKIPYFRKKYPPLNIFLPSIVSTAKIQFIR